MSDGKKLPVLNRSTPAGPKIGADPFERLLAGDSAGVIADLRERLEADPDDDVAWLQLGTAYAHIAHLSDAAAAFAKAVDLDGSVLEARRAYARILSRLRRVDEAAFQLVQAKRLAPDDARVAHELGVAFYDKRLFDKALRELDRARELSPEDARVRFALGLAHEAKGDMAEAIAAYRDAVRLDPEMIDARRTLADALAAMGEMAAAVQELAEAQARDRTNAQIALNLEVLQKGLRDLEAARLIGKGIDELERSALIELGRLERRDPEPGTVRYVAELLELWATFGADERITSLMLLLTDPQTAADTIDASFPVTVVSTDGQHVPANLATAATVTFLREALGCPLTRASELYAMLLKSRDDVRWAGSLISLAEVVDGGDARHGVLVRAG